MKNLDQRRSLSGFTLIELLVAIAVSGIVLAGLVSVFTTANRSYTLQDEMATLQQSLRVAKMNLERDVQMAGCGLGTSFNNLGTSINPFKFTNGADATDILEIWYIDFNDPCSDAIPQLTLLSSAGTTLSVNGTTDDWVSALTSGINVTYNGNSITCSPGGIFKAVYTRASDSAKPQILNSNVFNVTGVSTSSLTNDNTIGSLTVIPANNSIKFFRDSMISQIVYSCVGGVLQRNGIQLAENIEDLQFAFWTDTNDDGLVDDTEWVSNVNLDGSQTYQVRLVRISILGRSTRPLPGQSANTRPLIEDHNAGTVSEKYLRQLLQFEIKPRNLRD